jgi:hypothetical protein
MKTENTTATKNVLAQSGMRVKSKVKAGGVNLQHNQTIARGLRVKSKVRAGALDPNHNQTIIGDSKNLRVKSGVKAGGIIVHD